MSLYILILLFLIYFEMLVVVVERNEREKAMNKIENILTKFISKDKILIWK